MARVSITAPCDASPQFPVKRAIGESAQTAPPARKRAAICGQIVRGGRSRLAILSGGDQRRGRRKIKPRLIFYHQESFAAQRSEPPTSRTSAISFARCGGWGLRNAARRVGQYQFIAPCDTLKRSGKYKNAVCPKDGSDLRIRSILPELPDRAKFRRQKNRPCAF